MSQINRSEFQKELDRTLRPKLETLGFREVVLKDCMQPEFLFNKDRLWFGASFDYRDQYLETDLGRLFWFKDVMPRVIVLGDYGSYCPKLKSLPLDADNSLSVVATTIRESIENAVLIYNQRYEKILAETKNPKKLAYAKEFFIHLGDEVSKNDLARFAT